jgi:hypothetical protein
MYVMCDTLSERIPGRKLNLPRRSYDEVIFKKAASRDKESTKLRLRNPAAGIEP